MEATISEAVGKTGGEERGAGIDWLLVCNDSVGACMFAVGLLAILLGAPAFGIALWAACVWLDWRTLVYLRGAAERRTASTERAHLQPYIAFRVTSAGLGQTLAVVLGLYLVATGWFSAGFGVLAVAAGGIVANRGLSRLGTSLKSPKE